MLVLFSMFEDYPEGWTDTDELHVDPTYDGIWMVGGGGWGYRPLVRHQVDTLRYYDILEECSVGTKVYYRGGYSHPIIFLDYSNEYYPVGKVRIYTSYGNNIPTNIEGLYTYMTRYGREDVVIMLSDGTYLIEEAKQFFEDTLKLDHPIEETLHMDTYYHIRPEGDGGYTIVQYSKESSKHAETLEKRVVKQQRNKLSKKDIDKINKQVIISTSSKQTQEKNTMKNITDKLIQANKDSASQAAYLEAGRIATKEVSKLVSKQLPMMVRGYADTPLGRLLIANLANAALQHFRPEDQQLGKLTEAMMVSSFQEAIQNLNIDELIAEVTGNTKIKLALGKISNDTGSKEKEND